MTTGYVAAIETWAQFSQIAIDASGHLPDDYRKRVAFELCEINKQGLNSIWVEFYNQGAKFDNNPNNLLIPWVLHMLTVPQDPMAVRSSTCLSNTNYDVVAAYKLQHGTIPHDFLKDADVPDIDIDCLPLARDHIKKYAAQQYGGGESLDTMQVCSVGTWQTYKFKMALQDVVCACTEIDRKVIEKITSVMPEDVDFLQTNGLATCKGISVDEATGKEAECGTRHIFYECPKCKSIVTDVPTLYRVIHDNPALHDFYHDKRIHGNHGGNVGISHPFMVARAAQMVGRIRSTGMHSGALIIANSKLLGNIPLSKNKADGPWVSLWSEGRNAQLSKQGYIKWDILGLKTMEYIYNCCLMMEINRNITFGKPLRSMRVTLKDGAVIILPPHAKIIHGGAEITVREYYQQTQVA